MVMGKRVERMTSLPILYTPWTNRSSSGAKINTRHKVHRYTYGSYQEAARYAWTLCDLTGYEINCSSRSLGKNQIAYDAEVAASEEGIKAVSKSQSDFKHLSIVSDSISAIAHVKQQSP
jgi:hypothetical protein